MGRYAWALAVALAAAGPLLAAPPKNVVLMIADDLGMEVGCYGDRIARTPHIDQLARSGTRFVHAFASVSSCSASRATILTGMPTHMCGQFGHAHLPYNIHTFRTVVSVPAALKAAGYRTGVIAKLHVEPPEVYPFDVVVGNAPVPAFGRNPAAIAEQVRKFIADSADRPFFLLVGFADPHRDFGNRAKYPPDVVSVRFDPDRVPVPPFLPDAPETRAELAEYYQSIARLDDGVGRILRILQETGHHDDTLVIFLSDNGMPFPGAKTNLYDPGIHLPLIIRKPGQKAGIVNTAMVSWTDIAPTIYDWCGVIPPLKNKAARGPVGRSLLPILEQESPAGWDVVYGSHQFHEITMYYPMRMIRTRQYKYIQNLAAELPFPHAADLWASPTWQGVLKRNDMFLGKRSRQAYLRRPPEELYDLQRDPHEIHNLAADPAAAAVVQELREKLMAWRKATHDPWLILEQQK